MKNLFFNTITIVAFLLTSISLKAQPVITEYFAMKEPFKIEFNDNKVHRAVYTKGVLDLVWDDVKRILSVTYDPKLTRVEDIVRNIKEVANNSFGSASMTPLNASGRNDRDK